MRKWFRRALAVVAAPAVIVGGLALSAGSASASTPTCNDCTHVQNVYAFRGNLDALGQSSKANTPVVLWYGTGSTNDPAQDFRVVPQGTVSHSGRYAAFNQDYHGMAVVRFEYTPDGNDAAHVYLGLTPGTSKASVRPDNTADPDYQSYIEVPVDNTHNAVVLVNVGESSNPSDPMVLTDPGYAFTGSKTQIALAPASVNQNGDVDTSQLWRAGDYEAPAAQVTPAPAAVNPGS